MKKIITLTLTLTLTLGLMLTAQAQDELYVYRYGGVTDTLKLSEVANISHSRVDLQGRRHDDFVLMDVTLADGSVRRFPLEWLDSVVMQRGGERYRLVRFTGSMGDDGTLRSRRGLRRTSLDGDFSVGSEDGVQFFWETGDNIFIEDGNTAKYADSVVIREGKDVASFFFKDVSVTGDSIVVYYPGQSNMGYNRVVVKAAQTQKLPNNSEHLGEAGDCGTGIATRNGNVNGNVNGNGDGNGSINGYEFVLDHKATYLCFLPYIANDLGRTVLEKITVRSDSAIAGEFMLDTLGIHPLTNTTHTVTLTTGNFVLPRTANQYDCSAYMVIAPQNGPTRLTCEFTVRDTVLQSTGVYTKTVDLEEVEPNMVYVVKANCNNYVVDLGLPVKFLNHNLGAFAPEEYGDYYAWGETVDKGDYSTGTYTHYKQYLNGNIRLSDYDAAHVKLGANFSMPTREEAQQLVDSCTWSWTTVGGVSGLKLTSRLNNNTLFIPAAGYMEGTGLTQNGSYSFIRTSELLASDDLSNWLLSAHNNTALLERGPDTHLGESIRPVVSSGVQMIDGTTIQVMTDSARWQPGGTTATLFGTLHGYDKAKTKSTLEIGFLVGNAAQVAAGEGTMASATVTGDGRYSAVFTMPKDTAYYYRACVRERNGSTNLANTLQFGRAYADLGLPSGNLWSSVNIGCTQPEDKGDYYAWGETVTKATYTETNHRWYNGHIHTFPDGCLRDIHATRYDVATVKWGGTWVTPNHDDLQELIKYCTVTSETVNGMPGYRFTSKVEGYTNRSIFMPMTGWWSNSLTAFRESAYFSSSEMAENLNYRAYEMSNGGDINSGWSLYHAVPVRPVSKCNATSKGGNRMYIRTLPAGKRYNGSDSETDTLKAIIRGYTDDGTTAGIVWWLEGAAPETVTSVQLTPDAYGYVTTVIGNDPNNPLMAGKTYYYTGYVDGGTTTYYGDTLHIDAIGLVDLGLSVKWANMNIGAVNAEDGGAFYEWGATEPYNNTAQQYTANRNITPNSGRDIATNNWGRDFRMPTKAEYEELTNTDNCDWTWEVCNGINGYRVTSKKTGFEGKSIFLPAPGIFDLNKNYHRDFNGLGYYWSSTVCSSSSAYSMYFLKQAERKFYNHDKTHGFSVRAVQSLYDDIRTDGMRRSVRDRAEVDTLVSYLTLLSGRSLESGFILHTDSTNLTAANSSVRILPLETVVAGENKLVVTGLTPGQTYYYRAYFKDGDEYTYGNVKKFELIEDVDLGLSVMWTNINVGADYAEDCGDYYAWGETAPKNIYSQETYTYYQNGTWIELGSDIGGTQYDAASVNMGLRWRMPTQTQCKELLDNTTAKDTLVNGVKCWKLTSTKTGYTDRYIILPRYSQMMDGSLSENSGQGIYASSTRYDVDKAYYLYLSDGNANQNSSDHEYSKCWGKTIRAVVQKNTVDLGNGVYAHVATDGCDWEIGSTTATLRGHAALSAPVEGATRGFVVGTIKEVDKTTPDDGNIVTVAGTADAFTYDYTYRGGARYYRTFLKVGSTYYLGDVKAVTAADLLDVEFNGSNQAFHGTVSAIPVGKEGSSTCLYSDDYERYMADLSGNSAAGNASNYFRFDYGSATDFNQKLLNGHTLEVFAKPGEITSGWSDMIASYESGGDGLSIDNYKFCYCPCLSSYQYCYAEKTLPTTDKYYHFVGVWDKANRQVRVYVDGALDSTYVNVPKSMTATSTSHYIVGGNPSGTSSANEAFKGIIGFARIYSAALTDEQVQALYNTIKENKNTGE